MKMIKSALVLLAAIVAAEASGLENADIKQVVKPDSFLQEENEIQQQEDDWKDRFLRAVTPRKLGLLQSCQSDCDSNADCDYGLFCWQRHTGDPLPPCCSGYKPSDSRDFCVPNGCSTSSTPAPAPAPTPPTSGIPDFSIDVDVDVGDGVPCLSGDTIIEVQNKGPILMKDLQVGDAILTSTANTKTYERVYSFGHYHPTKQAEFVVLHTSDKKMLEISDEHLLFLQDKEIPVRAGSVQVGDKLTAETSVTKITTVVKTGIYAPLTPSASLVVNQGQAHVSSYAAIVQRNSNYAHFSNGIPIMSQQSFIHLVLSPFRVLCTTDQTNKWCDSYNHDGMPHYIDQGIALLTYLDQWPGMIQMPLFVVAFAFFGSTMVLEQVLMIVAGWGATGWAVMVPLITTMTMMVVLRSLLNRNPLQSAMSSWGVRVEKIKSP